MPALVILKDFTTRPFAGDDLHIVCLVLGFYRVIQFVCLLPLGIHLYLRKVNSSDVIINGIPTWCLPFDSREVFMLFVDELDDVPHLIAHTPDNTRYFDVKSFKRNNFGMYFVGAAIVYLAADTTWIGMLWSSASLGTPTETARRDGYVRKLIIFKAFLASIYPILLLIFGLWNIHHQRANNYGCGDGVEPRYKFDQLSWYGFYCALIVTYALELLAGPAILANYVMNRIKLAFSLSCILARSREARNEMMAVRLEQYVGVMLRLMQCVNCNRADFKNQGELRDFACHFMDLMNYNTKVDVVLSDIYVGLYMLSRVQREEKVRAIKRISKKNTLIRQLESEEQDRSRTDGSDVASDHRAIDIDDKNNAFPRHTLLDNRGGNAIRDSVFILHANDESIFDVCERRLLGRDNRDESLILDAAHYAKYAQVIYTRLKKLVVEEFMSGREDDAHFRRDENDMLGLDFRLGSIGLEHSSLCCANFVNSILCTPYAVLIDEGKRKVVVTIRGSLSLDDLVADLQYNPVSLEKTGEVCGFQGKGHYCHNGFLVRAKWLYNDIKKSRILKTIYSDQSPFKDYPLILCGHSLGAGCASILSIMLRPTFPSLRCFAFCPPGAVVDNDMANICDEFITAFVRQDDLIPRICHHNFENMRNEFMTVLARIKVPKIKLFFHVRQPCPDNAVAILNSKVLLAEEEIPRDTDFFDQMEKFRAEREDKKRLSGPENVNLYIPGKIVHLVDTKGNNTDYRAYVGYWADRCEDFNQVILSKRMKSDHSMEELVDILRVAHPDGAENSASSTLGGSLAFGASLALGGSMTMEDSDCKEDIDIRLFMCCSNPDGKLPIFLSLIAIIPLALSITSMSECVFFSRYHSALYLYGEKVLDLPFSVGLFGYTLLKCAEGSCFTCDEGVCGYDPQGAVVPSGYCVPYPDGDDDTAYMQASRVFALLVVLFGGMGLLLLCVSTCLSFRKWAWILITCIFLCTSLFQGLVFLAERADACISQQVVDFYLDSQCHITRGAAEAITAGCFYFIIATVSASFARSKSPKHSGDSNGRNAELQVENSSEPHPEP